MSKPSWQQIDAALDELLEIPAAQRRGRAKELSAGDAALEAELLSLLDGLEVADDPLERGMGGSAGELLAGLEAERVGAVEGRYRDLGPYRLGELIAVGGMGRVYRARREDGVYEREVAIKILRWELSLAGLIPRFEAERRILADLDHPAIARLLDGGLTEDGVPYLVMDLVEGQPIDRFCADHRLSANAIVELLLPVVDAVDYAHRRLVVHRDLKPANILVQADGQPKLLDFGVAKLLDPSSQAGLTVGGTAPYTPAFAAPEQLRGEAVSTATDVYALGCLLYALLTGELPFREPTPGQPDERLQGRIPRPPSQLMDGAGKGELDAIVLKCLHPEAEGRYTGAGALGADLQALLDGLPVRAVPPSRAYRFGKLLRRHALASTFAALALLALLVGMGSSLYLGVEARQERDRARRLADLSLEMLRLGDPQDRGGGRISVQELLEASAERAVEIADPSTRGRLLAAVGEGLTNLEVMDQAAVNLLRAIEALEAAGETERVPELLRMAAEPLASSGRLEEGLEAGGEAIRRSESRWGASSPQTAAALYGYAFLLVRYMDQTDPRREQARELLERAISLQRLAAPAGSEAQAKSLHLLGMLRMGEFRRGGPEAETAVEEGLALMRRAVAMRSDLGGPDGRAMIDSLNDLALSLDGVGRFEEGFEVMGQAMAIADQRLEGSNPTRLTVRQNLAAFYRDAGELEVARILYQEVVDGARAAGLEPNGAALFGLARVTASLDDLATAEALAREGFDSYADSDIRHWILGELLGEIYRRQGRFAEARDLLARAAGEFARRQGDDSPRAQSARRELAAARAQSRRPLWTPPQQAPSPDS